MRRARPADRAEPLRTSHLRSIFDQLPGAPGDVPPLPDAPAPKRAAWLRGVRDRALLMTGFAGALRRSELSALLVRDVAFEEGGYHLYLARSKTDQEGAGHEIGVAAGEHAATCPVQLLRRWLAASGLTEGPLFRGVFNSAELRPGPLTGRSISTIVKKTAEAAGIEAEPVAGSKEKRRFSGHSLRAGHITEAVANGAPEDTVMNQSRHTDRETFDGYVRRGRSIEESSSKFLGV